jgi:hypothetical protein
VDPVPDSLLLRKFSSVGNRTRISGSLARNSGHYTTEAVVQVYVIYHQYSTETYAIHTAQFRKRRQFITEHTATRYVLCQKLQQKKLNIYIYSHTSLGFTATFLLSALGSGVHSPSNRTQYHKQKNNVSGEQSAAGV